MVCPNCGTENIAGARFCRNCGNALASSEVASPFGETAVAAPEYMGFWIRVVAYLIDAVVLGIVGFIVGLLVGAIFGENAQTVSSLVGLVIGWLYFAYLESSERQATLGKLALGMIVTDLNGQRISFGRATGRYFAKIISAIPFGLGFMWVGWDARKQGWHDKIASTLVVKKQA
jgi:uncharacterized RDD family membrane protein YckC